LVIDSIPPIGGVRESVLGEELEEKVWSPIKRGLEMIFEFGFAVWIVAVFLSVFDASSSS
jgi:hypothetical protein